ncbi:efflux RND transporter permease subunit [Xanthomonas sp. NCPPB 2632]|uniref:efflux RND transporter permease subunit n=1 Tax=Xanthomonas sp. NCPPB 2632 TaxID=3240912 RepID=UPI003517416B
MRLLTILRPIGVTLLCMGILIGGVLAYHRLAVAALPDVDLPRIYVQAELAGANPQVMATSVIAPLERGLAQMPGVEALYSSSAGGTGFIQISLDRGSSIERAKLDAQAAINRAVPLLPAGMASPPTVYSYDSGVAPVMLVAMVDTRMSRQSLYDIADRTLSPYLASLDGVAGVKVLGGSPNAIQVDLDATALVAKSIVPNDVANAIRAASPGLPLGQLTTPTGTLTIDASDVLNGPRELARVPVLARSGVVSRLSEVADIRLAPLDPYQQAWLGAKPAVFLLVNKKPSANAIATAASIHRQLDMLLPMLPAGIEIHAVFDLTDSTKNAVDEVLWSLVFGIVAVVAVVWCFTRRMAVTLIVSASIPLTLAATFVVMLALGYTLNLVTLLSLAICVGLVVDDSIVVSENIFRHVEDGMDSGAAAAAGLRETGFTVATIALSLIVVFIPVLAGQGEIFDLLRQFSVTLAVAIAISAVISLTVAPVFCARYLGGHMTDQRPRRPWQLKVARYYECALAWTLRHRRIARLQPWLMLALTVVLYSHFVSTGALGYVPQEDTGLIRGVVRLPHGMSPDETASSLARVRERVLADPDVRSLSTVSTSPGANTLYIELRPRGNTPGHRGSSISQVVRRLGRTTSDMINVAVFFNAVQYLGNGSSAGPSMPGLPNSFQLLSLGGQDLKPWMNQLTRRMRAGGDFDAVDEGTDDSRQEYRMVVDRSTMSRLGLSMATIDQTLYDTFGGHPVATLPGAGNPIQVVLRADSPGGQFPSALLDMQVRSNQSAMVPASAFARIETDASDNAIVHQNQIEAREIGFSMRDGRSAAQGMEAIQQAARDIGLPGDIRILAAGEALQTQKARQSGLGLVFAAILAAYVVLGMLYDSLLHPLTVLSTVPAACAGALMATAATHNELNLISILAILLLIGIGKRNTIILVDFALTAERTLGLSPVEAIRRAAMERGRPIAMTTVVAIVAALPLAIGLGPGSELRVPLGIATVGGLIVSQSNVVFAVPAIYLWSHDAKQWWRTSWLRTWATRCASPF